jgi:long-subunit fatty acid transport protein
LTDTSNTPLRSFNYEYQYDTKGIGMNIKLGAIYLVSESLRFGFAVHSSTFAELEDNYSANMSATFEDSIVQISESSIPEGNYKYKIRNPGKIVGSIAYVFGTKGCLNLDIDYLNYKNARFKTTEDLAYTPYDYAYENKIAKTVFQDAVNIRLGGELVVFPGFYLRAGIGHYGNAYRKSEKVELNSDLMYSGGIGIKTKLCTLDVSYRHRSNKRNYYAFSNSQAEINSSTGIIVFSSSISF